jgi:plasmid stabilization system protein ParE
MTFKVIAEAQAKAEWNDAVNWYEDRQTGVGLRFDDALRTLLQTLSQNPQRFRRCTQLTHKAKVPPPWPYSVYFTIDTTYHEVVVLAIWHGARNPAALRRRLK